MNRPQSLQPGDKVGIFVPSSPIKPEYREKGLAAIRTLGYEPVEVPHILSRRDFLAKEPGQGIADIQELFNNPEIKALWAGRGGYGSNHLLPLLTSLNIKIPRILIGSSDVSYLLWYLLDRFDMPVFYGPMAYSSLAENRANNEQLTALLAGEQAEIEIPGAILSPGCAEGIVTGGCLSNLVSLVGTEFMPRVEERILLLEDVAERPYRLDRMFWQLHQAGVLSSIRGLLLGRFPGCFNDSLEKVNFLARVLKYVDGKNIPVIYDLPFGHGEDIHCLPLGIELSLDTGFYRGIVIKDKGVAV